MDFLNGNCLRYVFESFAFFVVLWGRKNISCRTAMASDTQRRKWAEWHFWNSKIDLSEIYDTFINKMRTRKYLGQFYIISLNCRPRMIYMTNFNKVDLDVCVIAHSIDILYAMCIISWKSIVVARGRTLGHLVAQTKVGESGGTTTGTDVRWLS